MRRGGAPRLVGERSGSRREVTQRRRRESGVFEHLEGRLEHRPLACRVVGRSQRIAVPERHPQATRRRRLGGGLCRSCNATVEIPQRSSSWATSPTDWLHSGQVGTSRATSTRSSVSQRAACGALLRIARPLAAMTPHNARWRRLSSPRRPSDTASRRRSRAKARLRSRLAALAAEGPRDTAGWRGRRVAQLGGRHGSQLGGRHVAGDRAKGGVADLHARRSRARRAPGRPSRQRAPGDTRPADGARAQAEPARGADLRPVRGARARSREPAARHAGELTKSAGAPCRGQLDFVSATGEGWCGAI